jgi:hypothetical protein
MTVGGKEARVPERKEMKTGKEGRKKRKDMRGSLGETTLLRQRKTGRVDYQATHAITSRIGSNERLCAAQVFPIGAGHVTALIGAVTSSTGGMTYLVGKSSITHVALAESGC